MIQDSLARYSPEDSLQTHACAAALRYKLGFADAAAITLRMQPGTPDVIFVDVREPQDSGRVRYREMPMDTVSPRAEWRLATQVLGASPRSFRAGVVGFHTNRRAPPADTLAGVVAEFLASRTSASDFDTALHVLASAPNYRDRAVAALILTNFPGEPATWSALLDGMRESDGIVKSWAAEALRVVAASGQRAPAWAVLSPAIHDILDGTSLFLLDGLIEVLLQRDDIGPHLAAPFLARGGEMLVNFAANPQPARSAPARALLVKLRGADLGPDPGLWRDWIAGLGP
jgi:hypothetical protein